MVCAMIFAEQFCAAMAERGMTGRQLARRVPCHPSLVCHFRSGRKRPSAKMAAQFDAASGVGGELIEAARADGALPDRRSVLAGGGLLAGALLVGPEVAIAEPASAELASDFRSDHLRSASYRWRGCGLLLRLGGEGHAQVSGI